MGSHTFTNTVWDEETPHSAYAQISDEFRVIHDDVVRTHAPVVSEYEAFNLVRSALDGKTSTVADFGIEPWGNAGAIELYGEDTLSSREVRVTVTAGTTYGDALSKVKLREGERVVHSQLIGSSQHLREDAVLFASDGGVKAAVESTPGTARTVYRLYVMYGSRVSETRAGDADTLAEARVKFSEYVEKSLDGHADSNARYVVRGVQIKGDSESLLTITPKPRRGSVTLVFSVTKFAPNDRRGWLLWGWAKD